jgi:hypothetical protein
MGLVEDSNNKYLLAADKKIVLTESPSIKTW